MLMRVPRLYNGIQEHFRRHLSNRALLPMEWQAVRDLVSVLDDQALVSTRTGGGGHAFLGQVITGFAILLSSLSDCTQEIRYLDPWNDLKKEIAVPTLREEVRAVLSVLVKDINMTNRSLGRATNEPERIHVVRDPRYKSSCDAGCSTGSAHL